MVTRLYPNRFCCVRIRIALATLQAANVVSDYDLPPVPARRLGFASDHLEVNVIFAEKFYFGSQGTSRPLS